MAPTGTLFLLPLLSLASYTRQFEVGTNYKFAYESSVLLNEPRPDPSPRDVGFKVELTAEVTPVWQHPSNGNEQILKLQVAKPQLGVKSRNDGSSDGLGFVQKTSRVNSYSMHPLYLHWSGGSIKKVYHVKDDELSMLNIKKGISSLLQIQTKDITQTEVDASGKCEVTYKMQGSNHLTKTKRNCRTVTPVLYHNQTNEALGADVESQVVTTYELGSDDKMILKATGTEMHFLRVNVRRQSGAEAMSTQLLEHKASEKINIKKHPGGTAAEAVKSIAKSLKQSLVADQLATKQDPKECILCKTLPDLINSFRKSLASSALATQSSAIAFIRIMRKVREGDEKTLEGVLKDTKNKKILPQLLDIYAAAQTVAAHKAAKKVLKFTGQIALPERYLMSLSLTTHPLEFVIQDLLKMSSKGLKNDKLFESLMLTIGTLTNTFTKIPGNAKKPVIAEVKKQILDQLNKCKDESCQMMYIRTLKNLKAPDTVDVLLTYAAGKEHKPAIYAARALQTMPQGFLKEKHLKKLERIFFQLERVHDSSVRAMSIDMLLRNSPSEKLIKDVLFTMSNPQSIKELNTVILTRIQDLAENNEKVNKILRKVLSDPQIGNYHILSQMGLSSAFSRPLAETQSANASFSSMLEINGGLLKRSTVDAFVQTKDSEMRLLSFGIFAGGMSMFGGSDAVDDGEDANAGIEITLLNNQLRPFIFFTGQGELMGHVWAGTGSERTTALQGSLLLQDHHEVKPLQNGLNADLILTGVISFDFAGQAEVSLWNQNSHSVVELGAALVVQGQARVDNSFVQTLVEFNTGAATQLNFVTDLEFSGKVLMCLKMIQPNFEVITNLRKLERIQGSNYHLKKYKRKTANVPGKTFVMNKKNTELCNEMANR
ncbi:unnamed protein product [Meganyctiphanes norvegica]|uniref:Vitellogenin domain-containing protein n=1 Tax=Meganyctiphanes norvegica TaxID=48144 RepID=A0AAV2RDH0_MEGNR